MIKRYEIQCVQLNDTLRGNIPEWKTFYSAKSCRTLKGARKEWLKWVNTTWDFVGDRPVFRIWDRKTREVAE